MANAEHVSAVDNDSPRFSASTRARSDQIKSWGLLAAIVALTAIVLMLRPDGLSVAGQNMLGIFAFAVIVWMTEAIDYAASSIVLMALITLLIGIAPDPDQPAHIFGTSRALSVALEGFTNPAVALIAASLVIATAMGITGLDKRLAYMVILLIGTRRSHLLIGTIIVMALLAFFVPTASARVACLVPIILGLISALGIDRKSRVAGMLMMSIVYLSLIWAMGIATGAAQNVYVNALLDRTINVHISWIDWLTVGAPFSIALSVALYFVLMKMMTPGQSEPDVAEAASGNLSAELGPITTAEIRLLVFSLILLGFWATEHRLHSFDSATVAIAVVALMFLPKIGVITWNEVQARIPWGILVQLGVGVGLGITLLKTGAAGWLAEFVVDEFGVQHLSSFAMLAVLWLFLIVVHLGFSSGAAMATTMIPVLLSVFLHMQIPVSKVAGMTMFLAFVTSVGWILPINGPQNMLAFGTGTFEARDFVRVGSVMTVITYLMLLFFASTWWHWLGYI